MQPTLVRLWRYDLQVLLSAVLFLSQKALLTRCHPMLMITLDNLLLNKITLLNHPPSGLISPRSVVTHGDLSLQYSDFEHLGDSTSSAATSSTGEVPRNYKVHDIY